LTARRFGVKSANMDLRLQLLIIFLVSAVITIVLGLPLKKRKVKPNWFYGFRTPATLKDEALWYDVNEKTGTDLVVIGNVLAVLAAAMFGLQVSPGQLTGICVAWILMGGILSVFRCFVFVSQRSRLSRKGGL
jgi:hypothetical protein